MFTSHEQEADYDHFFDSLLVECKCLGLKFEPKFICTDAAHPIANSIEYHFSDEKKDYFCINIEMDSQIIKWI